MILLLSTADTDLLALDAARRVGGPPVRAANPAVLPAGRLDELLRLPAGGAVVVMRLHGGRPAAVDAVDAVVSACRARSLPLLALSGDGQPGPDLDSLSTASADVLERAQGYLSYGGTRNLEALVRYLSDTFLGTSYGAPPPAPQPLHGVYGACSDGPPSEASRADEAPAPARPCVGILFYRAHWLSGNLAFVDALVRALELHGCSALAVFCESLRPRGGDAAHVLERYFMDSEGRARVDAVISTLSFAASRLETPGENGLEEATEATGDAARWLERLGVPVLQALVCTEPRRVWEERASGLGPLDVTMQVALPEFDGRIVTVPVCFKDTGPDAVARYVPDEERCAALASQAAAWARLRRTPNGQKRVAIVLGNSPPRNGRLGNAVGLDTPASLVGLLRALRAAGYAVDDFPADDSTADDSPRAGDALMHRLIEAGTYDPEFGAPGVPGDEVGRGSPTDPPGLRLGNVFVGIQPPRGWDDDPDAIYHDPELPPPAAYTGFYRWLRTAPSDGFGAHAVIHLGKHGTLEWLPGKAVGLSRHCFPDALLPDLPLIYPFIVNDPGEGTQAKRRAHAVLVGHLIPPLAEAGLHGDLDLLERLLAEERHARALDPAKVPLLRRRVWEAVRAAALHEDLRLPAHEGSEDGEPDDAERMLARLAHYLEELRHATIRDGLHVLGVVPEGLQRETLLDAIVRLAPAERVAATRERVDRLLDGTGGELAAVLAALEGRYVPAGPSGSPSRGAWNVLPTGRNFYSVDPQAIPSPAAWETGRLAAEAVLARHLEQTGHYPRTVGLVVWGTAAMRTHGDDIAQALALLGVRPVWRPETGRVAGVQVVPAEELGRPRVDVTLRISGFFRDAFPHLVRLLDRAVRLVGELDEPDAQNFVAAHVRSTAARLAAGGADPRDVQERAARRIFGSKPGCYGAGLLPLIEQGNWRTAADLARAYEAWGAYAYGADVDGVHDPASFRERFAAIDAAVKNQDNREHDVFDSDDYFQYHGGMVATAAALRGEAPRAYVGDTADPARPVVRDLDQEARRVFRTRVANPQWLAAMRRHGYKGAFEMAATVDYLFGYDATAGVASDWMYEQLAEAYAFDAEQRAFFARSNPWALHDIAARLLEAASRGLWREPAPDTLERLRRVYLEIDGDLEARHERLEADRAPAVPAVPAVRLRQEAGAAAMQR